MNLLDSWVRNTINTNFIDTNTFKPGILVNTNDFNEPDFRPTTEYPSNFKYGVLGFYGVTQVKVVGKVKSVSAYPNPTNGEYTVEPVSHECDAYHQRRDFKYEASGDAVFPPSRSEVPSSFELFVLCACF